MGSLMGSPIKNTMLLKNCWLCTKAPSWPSKLNYFLSNDSRKKLLSFAQSTYFWKLYELKLNFFGVSTRSLELCEEDLRGDYKIKEKANSRLWVVLWSCWRLDTIYHYHHWYIQVNGHHPFSSQSTCFCLLCDFPWLTQKKSGRRIMNFTCDDS